MVPNFITQLHKVGEIQSIATSSSQGDGGLFGLNSQDERYLLFEGAGVISQKHIEINLYLPPAILQVYMLA